MVHTFCAYYVYTYGIKTTVYTTYPDWLLPSFPRLLKGRSAQICSGRRNYYCITKNNNGRAPVVDKMYAAKTHQPPPKHPSSPALEGGEGG